MGQRPLEPMCRHTCTHTEAPSAKSLTSIYFPSPFPLPLSPAHFAELFEEHLHSKVHRGLGEQGKEMEEGWKERR